MSYEYIPPKYAQVIDELQRRIESGEYPPGSLLPSEHQLSAAFGVARPTVVRALRVLRDDGWIETHQGKGSFVRGRPALARVEGRRPGENALNRGEADEAGGSIEAGEASPSARIAALLGLAGDAGVIVRRSLARPGGKSSELVTWWVPAALADGTDLADPSPLRGGVRAHLARRKGVHIDHVLEQVVARHPTGREARLLGVGRTAALLALYVTGRDASGAAALVLEVVMTGERCKLEGAYQVA